MLEYGAEIDTIVDRINGYSYLMQICSSKLIQEKDDPITQNLFLEVIKFLLEHGASQYKKGLNNKNCIEIVKSNLDPNSNMNPIFKFDPASSRPTFYHKILEILDTSKQIYFYGNSQTNINNRRNLNNNLNNNMGILRKLFKCGCFSYW